MTLALCFLVATVAQETPVISFPPGVHPEFQRVCLAAQLALSAGQFDKAGRLLDRLPGSEIQLEWDDRNIPAGNRPSFEQARDEAIAQWARFPAMPRVLLAKKAAIKVSFEPKLNLNVATGLPAGAVSIYSEGTTPRLEVVIGLSRGVPAEPTKPTEVRNEIIHAVASYLGLGESPLFGTAAGRTDLPSSGRVGIFPLELDTIKANLAIVATLRKAVQERSKVVAGSAKLATDAGSLDAGEVIQGQPTPYSIQITNNGTGVLNYRTQGDCGCVKAVPPGTVKPGETVFIRPHIDTTDFVGELNKKLILFTNDTEEPAKTFPLKVFIRPKFRWFAPNGVVLVLDDKPGTAEVILQTPLAGTAKTEKTHIDGIETTFQMLPWSGELADPEMREGKRARTGTRYLITIDPKNLTGRRMVGVSVPTDDRSQPVTRTTFLVQKGIICLPNEVFMGQLPAGVKKFSTLVSRPGKPFKIRSATADSAEISLKFAPTTDSARPDEYKLEVTYLGKAPFGPVTGTITIVTDDPKQPKLLLPFQGTAG